VLCGMIYLPPYLIQGTHKLTGNEIETYASEYHQFLSDLTRAKIDLNDLLKYETTNDYLGKLISNKNA